MNAKLENEISTEEEMNLYDYWKVLVKKKKIFIGIFLIPLVIVTVITLSVPRYYRGECEINIPATPVPNIVTVATATDIVRIVGHIDDQKKVKIFKLNTNTIKNVSVSISKKSADRVIIVIEAKTADAIQQAFKDILSYIGNLPEIKGEIERINAERDLELNRLFAESIFREKRLIEAKKANLIFLNRITEINKRQESIININPADLIMKDAEISLEIAKIQQTKASTLVKKIKTAPVNPNTLFDKAEELNMEIMNLKQALVTFGTLSPISVTKQPLNSQISRIIIITGTLSLFAAIFVVFFLLEYIERSKRSRE